MSKKSKKEKKTKAPKSPAEKKKMRKKILKTIFDVIVVFVGNTLFALAVRLFIEPNNLVMAGVTGLGIMAEKLGIMQLSHFAYLFNIAMFILGAAVLGKKFALTTLISTVYYPAALDIIDYFIGGKFRITDNLMLSAVCAGLMLGVAIGLVFRVGSSTGGMDVPPLVLKKLFSIPLVISIYFFDLSVMLMQIIVNTPENICFGVVTMVIYTIVIDKIVIAGNIKIQVTIISPKSEEIVDSILYKLDRGVTLLHGTTGFKREQQQVVMTVVSKHEYNRLRKTVLAIDNNAFIIANEISDVKGRGFSLDKIYGDSM